MQSRVVQVAIVASVLITAFGLSGPAAGAETASPTPTPSVATVAPGSRATTATPQRVTFGLGPATKGKVDTRQGISILNPRGATASDQVALVNLSPVPLKLDVYVADALNAPDGALQIQPRASKRSDPSLWVSLKLPRGKSPVTVPAGGTVIVPLTVKIPANAAIGDHLAGVVASLVAKGQSSGGLNTPVTLDQRVAMKLAIRVAGPLFPKLTVEGLTAGYVGTLNPVGRGLAVVTYTVRNTGNVRLAAHQQVRVHGVVGGPADAGNLQDIPLLLPGGSATVSVVVPDVLPLLVLSADVNIEALIPPGDADPEIAPSQTSASFWAIPWTLIAVLLVVGLLGLWWWRRRSTPEEPSTGRRMRGTAAPQLIGPELVAAQFLAHRTTEKSHMLGSRRLASAALIALLSAIAIPLLAPAAAQADTVQLPFNDQRANGYIGLCDRYGKPVTTGKLSDIPFIWTAVSSTPAPKAYVGPLGKAILAIYQPRKDVDPGEWSGKFFTAASTYSNPDHPMAQGTNLDRPLVNFTSVAPLWQGLLQLRLIYSNVDATPSLRSYPATVIMVQGNTWSVVAGGRADCGAGRAVSTSTFQLRPGAIPSASPTLQLGTSAPKPGATNGTGSSAPASSAPSPAASPGSSDPVSQQSQSATSQQPSTFNGSPWAILGLLALPVVGVVVAFIAARSSAVNKDL